jgi:hypothetical protein
MAAEMVESWENSPAVYSDMIMAETMASQKVSIVVEN